MTHLPVPRGRPFANGNPGRKPGSRNRTTLLAAALLDGKAEELLRKAVEIALAGDVAMLKFLLDRILPRERLVKLDLPRMEFADDVVEALGKVMSDVADGRMTSKRRCRNGYADKLLHTRDRYGRRGENIGLAEDPIKRGRVA